jgi:Protein of unknown function (DUF3179)
MRRDGSRIRSIVSVAPIPLRGGGPSEPETKHARGPFDRKQQRFGAPGARVDVRGSQQRHDAVVRMREHARRGGTRGGDLGRPLVEVNSLERDRKALSLLAPVGALAQSKAVRDLTEAATGTAAELAEHVRELARERPARVVDAGQTSDRRHESSDAGSHETIHAHRSSASAHQKLVVIQVAIVAVALVALAAGCGDSSRSHAGTATERDPSSKAVDFRAEGWKTDFARRKAPLSEFLSGGPPKDGIPAIDSPRFMTVDAVDFMRPQEPVIELIVDGQARAYPIQILIWHEIVNDTVAGVPVAVTFCPLCNTALVFDRRVNGTVLDFGTTGKLRHSDLVMYDRQTESWWQQFGGDALVGEYAGTRLELLPARIVAWREFASQHPNGRVLSRETGHDRPYGSNPYEGYDDVDSPPIAPVPNTDDNRLPPKERVVFIERGGEVVVVPYSALERKRVVRGIVGGERLLVRFRPGLASPLDSPTIAEGREVGAAEVLRDGRLVEFQEPFWFVVAAFRPGARVVR